MRRPLAAALLILIMLSLSGTPLAATSARADSGTGSAVTVRAADYDPDVADSPFPNLAVTVSQTKDLIQQGITVSWTGGKQSTVPSTQTGGENFLQIMQCWGDEPGSNGTRPDRTTCQYGGLNVPGDSRWSTRTPETQIPPQDTDITAIGEDYFHPTVTAVPFRSATGVTLASVAGGARVPDAPDLNSNEFFTRYTTNEVSWAGSDADGKGSVSFELQTAQDSPGLGCGAAVTGADGAVSGASCWLVIVPRGDADASLTSITKSGLFWETWKHHLAVRLSFQPEGVRCAIGAAERQLSGSELMLGAVGQWQPTLCGRSGGAVYSLLTGPESDAALAANGTDPAPLALTSQALATDGGSDSLAYAPIAVTGVSVAFAIDRKARVIGAPVPAEVAAKERQAFSSMKLTPRLLAKLLTGSYTDALPLGANLSHISKIRNITQDPDFLAINDPEWASMNITGPGVGDLLVPLGRSDAAVAVWKYILADPDAAAFLAGKPDPWGMKVNPYYSTNAKVNPTKAALGLPAQDFPKADPVEFKGTANYDYADSINLVTWRPYTSGLQMGAYRVLTGDPQALGGWDPNSQPPKYGKGSRALVGLQAVIGLTDTASAEQYQVVQASLRNPAGRYVLPSASSLSAAASAMVKDKKQPQVVGFDPTSTAAKKAAAAYPLTMPVYAAVNPAMKDAAVRADYANFITFAAGSGQQPGTGDGQLPAGYTPLPDSWRAQAREAAAAIKNGGFPPEPTPNPTTAIPTSAATGNPVPTVADTTAASDPTATGNEAGQLAGPTTPADPNLGAAATVIPATAAVGMAAVLGVPFMSRFRRRRL